ncbi:HNH endonuclease [Chloroflexota bacterium]
MKEQLRQSILKGDGNRCLNCHSNKDLEIHHYVAREECKLFEQLHDPDGVESVFNHPHNLFTLCHDCHSFTFVGKRKRLLTFEEQEEWKGIWEKEKELSRARKELKSEYYGNWDSPAYQGKKQAIDRALKKLKERASELNEVARVRSDSKRKEVEGKLLDILIER